MIFTINFTHIWSKSMENIMSTSASATDFWATLVWIMTPRFDYEILYNCTDPNSQPASSLMLCALLIIANYSSHGPYARSMFAPCCFPAEVRITTFSKFDSDKQH